MSLPAKQNRPAFTMLEMMAVVMIIMVLTASVTLVLFNSSDSVKVRKDAAQMVAFMRNMWDRTRTTGSPLILSPDFEGGDLYYTEPRSGHTRKASLSSEAQVVAIVLNDRVYSAGSGFSMEESYDENGDPVVDNGIYISEGRGLTRIGVAFAVVLEDGGYELAKYSALNLINGKGEVFDLTEEEIRTLIARSYETESEEVSSEALSN